MTTLTLRRIKNHFVVTGPDIEPTRFKSRPEARDWCRAQDRTPEHLPGPQRQEFGCDRTPERTA